MMLRRVVIAGICLDFVAAAATAKLVTVGPNECPVAADAGVYRPSVDVTAVDVTPRLRVEKSVVVLQDVRLDASSGGLLFARLRIDPETGTFFGVEPHRDDCRAAQQDNPN